MHHGEIGCAEVGWNHLAPIRNTGRTSGFHEKQNVWSDYYRLKKPHAPQRFLFNMMGCYSVSKKLRPLTDPLTISQMIHD
jgi:hypothetical protein